MAGGIGRITNFKTWPESQPIGHGTPVTMNIKLIDNAGRELGQRPARHKIGMYVDWDQLKMYIEYEVQQTFSSIAFVMMNAGAPMQVMVQDQNLLQRLMQSASQLNPTDPTVNVVVTTASAAGGSSRWANVSLQRSAQEIAQELSNDPKMRGEVQAVQHQIPQFIETFKRAVMKMLVGAKICVREPRCP